MKCGIQQEILLHDGIVREVVGKDGLSNIGENVFVGRRSRD